MELNSEETHMLLRLLVAKTLTEYSSTNVFPEGKRDSRDPAKNKLFKSILCNLFATKLAKRRGVLALALGKRSCFAEYLQQ